MEIKIPKLSCKRCDHSWNPRKNKIRICPKCKSPYWNKKKENKTMRAILPILLSALLFGCGGDTATPTPNPTASKLMIECMVISSATPSTCTASYMTVDTATNFQYPMFPYLSLDAQYASSVYFTLSNNLASDFTGTVQTTVTYYSDLSTTTTVQSFTDSVSLSPASEHQYSYLLSAPTGSDRSVAIHVDVTRNGLTENYASGQATIKH